jgi:hypothetical protein
MIARIVLLSLHTGMLRHIQTTIWRSVCFGTIRTHDPSVMNDLQNDFSRIWRCHLAVDTAAGSLPVIRLIH